MTDWNVTVKDAALPATATVYSASGLNISDLINYGIVALLLVQIAYTIAKWLRERKLHNLNVKELKCKEE